MINFPALVHLRKLQTALERGHAPSLMALAPDVLTNLRIALKLHDHKLSEVDFLSKPLIGLADKICPIDKNDKFSEWRLKPGVEPMEFIYNLESLINANNEIRRD